MMTAEVERGGREVVKWARQYEWQTYYEAAILETDRSRLAALVRAAQTAINKRIEELGSDHQATPEEQDAIESAVAGLRILEKDIP